MINMNVQSQAFLYMLGVGFIAFIVILAGLH